MQAFVMKYKKNTAWLNPPILPNSYRKHLPKTNQHLHAMEFVTGPIKSIVSQEISKSMPYAKRYLMFVESCYFAKIDKKCVFFRNISISVEKKSSTIRTGMKNPIQFKNYFPLGERMILTEPKKTGDDNFVPNLIGSFSSFHRKFGPMLK